MKTRLLALLLVSLAEAAYAGVGINLPLAGRLVGGGNTLFRTSIDVSNHTAVDAAVRFQIDGREIGSDLVLAADGTIGVNGAIGGAGSSGVMRARTSAHYDDFISSLVTAGLLPSSVLTNGFLGSVFFVFDVPNRAGAAGVTARFYNDLAGGTVGVSLKGRELTSRETQQLVATISDTRGVGGGAPRLYPNLFINNIGVGVSGTTPAGAVTVEISAVSARNGQPIGTPITIANLAPGQTASVNQVLNALQVPASSDPMILIFARVISGTAAIQGLISQVDDTTRDGALFEMSRGDF